MKTDYKLIFDHLLEREVILATGRELRLNFKDYSTTYLNNRKNCPFCPGNESMTPEEVFSLKNDEGEWSLKIFPNKFPIVSDNITTLLKGYHELLVETPDHDISLKDMPYDKISDIFVSIKKRFLEYRKSENIEYTLFFKNYGYDAGASARHNHWQLMGLTVTPSDIKRKSDNLVNYYKANASCYICEIIDKAVKDQRLISAKGNFLLIVPHLQRFLHEIWILPKDHKGRFEDTKDSDLKDIGYLLKDGLKRIAASYPEDELSYNIVLFNSLSLDIEISAYHFRIEIFLRKSKLAGLELGTNLMVNYFTPDQSASILKQKL